MAWRCSPKQKKLKRLKRVNKTYHQLRVLLVLLTEEKALDDLIKEALAENNTPISNSQLQGWRVLSGHKNLYSFPSSSLGMQTWKLQLPVSRSWSFDFAVPKLELGNQKIKAYQAAYRAAKKAKAAETGDNHD